MPVTALSAINKNQTLIPVKQIIFVLGLFLSINGLLLWAPRSVKAAWQNRIMPFVQIGEVSVGGQTRAEVYHRLISNQSKKLSKSIQVQLGEITRQTTMADLGVIENIASEIELAYQVGRNRSLLTGRLIPTQYRVNQERLVKTIRELFGEVEKSPEPARISIDKGLTVISQSHSGLKFEWLKIENILVDAIGTKENQVDLFLDPVKPAITADQLTAAKQQADDWLAKNIQIQIDGQVITVTKETIGQWIEFIESESSIAANLSHDRVKEYIANLAKKYNHQAKSAIVYEDGEVIQEGTVGRQLNQNQLLLSLMAVFESDRNNIIVANFLAVPPKTQTKTRGYIAGRVDGKYIELNLSKQLMYTFEGESNIGSYRVSTGKWSMPTPEGEFEINNKIDVAYSSRYNLYMPRWMAFIGSKYGIHGLPYWANGHVEGEDHLGRPVSHGCIRLSHADVETVYNWADVGTKVFIHK